MRPISRPHFPQDRPALRHHVGQAKRSADFDHLASRDHNFASVRQRIQRKHNRSRIIVNDSRSLSAGKRTNLIFNKRIAIAAPTSLKIVFQVDRRPRRNLDRFYRRLSKNSPPKIGMQNDASSIDDRKKPSLIRIDRNLRSSHNRLNHRVTITWKVDTTRNNRSAQSRLRPLHLQLQITTTKPLKRRNNLRRAKTLIDRRQPPPNLRDPITRRRSPLSRFRRHCRCLI
jgi:hypothetical protein